MAIFWPGQRNGHISLSLMELVLGYRLHPAAAVSFLALRTACFLATGVWLGISDAYRPYAEQERVFRARYTPGHASGIRWAGTYWRKRPGVAAAAVPGYSNHGWGLALDINNYGSTSGRVFRWLLDHAGAFGWSWTTGRNVGEPWHWEYVGSLVRPASGGITPIVEKPEEFDMSAIYYKPTSSSDPLRGDWTSPEGVLFPAGASRIWAGDGRLQFGQVYSDLWASDMAGNVRRLTKIDADRMHALAKAGDIPPLVINELRGLELEQIVYAPKI